MAVVDAARVRLMSSVRFVYTIDHVDDNHRARFPSPTPTRHRSLNP